MDVGDDSTAGDCGLNECVEFFVTTNGQLEMAGRDTLDLQVLAGVAGQLKYFGSQVLEDGGRVDGGGGTDTVSLMDRTLQEPVDTTDGELKSCLRTATLRCLLAGWGLSTLSSLTAFSSFARLYMSFMVVSERM